MIQLAPNSSYLVSITRNVPSFVSITSPVVEEYYVISKMSYQRIVGFTLLSSSSSVLSVQFPCFLSLSPLLQTLPLCVFQENSLPFAHLTLFATAHPIGHYTLPEKVDSVISKDIPLYFPWPFQLPFTSRVVPLGASPYSTMKMWMVTVMELTVPALLLRPSTAWQRRPM